MNDPIHNFEIEYEEYVNGAWQHPRLTSVESVDRDAAIDEFWRNRPADIMTGEVTILQPATIIRSVTQVD